MKRLHRRTAARFRKVLQKAEELYRLILLRLSRSVYYIGGSDVLPPPLHSDEEEKNAEGLRCRRYECKKHSYRT